MPTANHSLKNLGSFKPNPLGTILKMKDLRLSVEEIDLLSQMIGKESVSIIWDLNAFYFNVENSTFKLECFDAQPEGSDFEYDKIFFCRFSKVKNQEYFKKEDSKYWYKILINQAKVIGINIVEVAQKFPDNQLVDLNESSNQAGINKISLRLTNMSFIA
jgi:hypothetical protein